MHRLFNYLTILASRTQHQIQLAGYHGVQPQPIVALAIQAKFSPTAAAIAAIATWIIVILIMTFWLNHFWQRWVILTQFHFG
jgi:hypothetical protein